MFKYLEDTRKIETAPNNKENSTTIQVFNDLLKRQGYMTLGNPYIKITPCETGNNFALGLLTKTNPTQIELCSGKIYMPPSNKLSVAERLFEALNTTQIIELDNFIEKQGSGVRIYDYRFSFDINLLRRQLWQGSKTKCLTFGIAAQILSEDSTHTDNLSERTKQDLHSLLQHYNAAHNPEQLTYLARMSSLPMEDRKEMLSLPLNYLIEGFGIPEGYNAITIPAKTSLGFSRQILIHNR